MRESMLTAHFTLQGKVCHACCMLEEYVNLPRQFARTHTWLTKICLDCSLVLRMWF